MAVPRLLIEIAASLGTFQADFARASSTVEQNTRRISKSIEDARTTAIGFGKTLAAAIGIPLSVGGVIALLDTIKDKTIEGERSVAQLNATLRTTGNAAGQTVKEIEQIAGGIREKTVFDDEGIRQAATALLRFRTIQGDAFKQALEQVPDLATALGTTLPNAATVLGKALIDPGRGLRALKEVGVSLSEQLIDQAARMVEAGDRAGAYKLVLDELKKSTGGAAEADNSGLYGGTKRLSRAIDDLMKTWGKQTLTQSTPALNAMADALDNISKSANDAAGSLDQVKPPGWVLREGLNALGFEGAGSAVGRLFNLPERGTNPQSASGRITLPDGRTPEEAAALQGRVDGLIKQASDEAYKQREAALRAAAGRASVFDQERFTATKTALDKQSQLYEFFYSQGEVSTQAFYDKQRQIAAASTEAQLALLGKTGKSIEALLDPANTFVTAAERPALVQRLQDVALQQYQARNDLAGKTLAIDIRQAEALRQIREEYERVGIALRELQGDTVGAAAAAFDQQNRRLRERATGDLNSPNERARDEARAYLAQADAVRALTVQQAALNQVQQDFGTILDAVGIAQSRIDLQRSTGAITELDALNQKANAAAALIPLLQKTADAYEEIARKSGDPRALIAAEQLKLKIEELGAAADAVGKKFSDVFVTSIADGITAVVQGGQKISDIIRNVEKSIVGGISQIASKNISEALFAKDGPLGGVGKFFGGLFGGKKDGVGTPPLFPPGSAPADAVKAASEQSAAALQTATSATELGASATVLTTAGTSLNAAAGALQAAAGTLSASSAAGGLGGAFGGFGGGGTSTPFGFDSVGGPFDLFGLGAFANGTDFARGGLSIVGERGPEILNIPRGAQVIPNDVLQAKRFQKQGGSRMSIGNINLNVSVAGSTNAATAGQIGAQGAKALRRILERYA